MTMKLASPPNTQAEVAPKPLRVLVAEDDETLREPAAKLLMDIGFDVTTATSRSQAVEKAQKMLPDVIIMDMHFEDGTGFDALADIDKKSSGRSMIVCAWTGRELEELKHQAKHRHIKINRWIAKAESSQETLRFLISILFEIRIQPFQRLIRKLEHRLNRYQHLLGDIDSIQCVGELSGKVIDVGNDSVWVMLEHSGSTLPTRVFPKKRFQHIDAAFLDASIKYWVFESGSINITKLTYEGTDVDEWQDDDHALTEEELQDFECRDRRSSGRSS